MLSREPRVRRVLAGFVPISLALGLLFALAMLAQTEPELPGDPLPPPESETVACLDCRTRVIPVFPEDGSGPKCPINPDHMLDPQ